MSAASDDPELPFRTQAAFRRWLAAEHARSSGIWVRLAKKASGIESVSYAECVEAALAYGWIDGKAQTIDGDWYRQRFTPRTARSKWSKINRDRATALIESGAMKAAGLREVERAQADGRWDAAYDAPSTATVPDDLRRALDAAEPARDFFATLDSRNRYAILHRIADAKKPETRARRIAKYVAMLSEGEKIY